MFAANAAPRAVWSRARVSRAVTRRATSVGTIPAVPTKARSVARGVGLAPSSSPRSIPGSIASRRVPSHVLRAEPEDAPSPPPPPPPEEPANNGKAIAGAGFALGVALFVGGLGGGAPTLASLEKDAVPLDVALANGRPTVVEFYADWCEVCKESAPNVFEVERRFGDDVNFVMLNIDNTKWGGEMDQYGVDGIPHIVFLDRKGVSEGQVVGKFPKQALEANVEALARGDPRLPYAKLADGAASPVQVAGIVETPGSTVDDPRGGAVSSADPRFHG